MNPAERDPRIDPRPGDVLRNGDETLKVVAVGWPQHTVSTPEGFTFKRGVALFRKWAKSAEVLTRAEDAQGGAK